ncbi:MAG: KEOPS complex N(6)-L-threonylcarbamoyladenine synthase Kae1 [Candidatus Micrarchaeaceae archaeon]
MIVIGIESSAHTFGVGIFDTTSQKILANEKEMYNVRGTGMIPAEVSEFHSKNAAKVIRRALHSAGVKPEDIGCVGYTKGPGIGTCLQIGMLSAKALAYALNVPLVPVNHAVAHIEIAKAHAKLSDPIAVYVSGGNSQILKLSGSHYSVLGETFDIGVGNMLDSFARAAHLVPAWGSTVAKLAKRGNYIEMPYTVKGMDFTFTGLLTHAKKQIGKASIEDICYSLQETAFAMICEAAERALLLTNSKELCVCGGVAQSDRLRQMLGLLSKEHGAKFGYAPNEYNADNGAMIAYVAGKAAEHGYAVPVDGASVEQRYRIEEAMVWQ